MTGFGYNVNGFGVGGGEESMSWQYSGGFSTSSQIVRPADLVWNGTHFWVIDSYNTKRRVYKYTAAGVYTGTSFSTYPNEQAAPEWIVATGIAWDGTSLWGLGSLTDRVWKFNASGSYQNVTFSVASQETNPEGITWDGTHFWIVGRSNDAVYKYNASGVYQNVSFSVAGQETLPRGITWDGTHFWVLGDNQYAYSYTAAGVYTGTSFYVAFSDPQGITWDGTSLWVSGYQALNNNSVYKYSYLPTP
jgi:hypothetical protein